MGVGCAAERCEASLTLTFRTRNHNTNGGVTHRDAWCGHARLEALIG
jgi:hypothetical protein